MAVIEQDLIRTIEQEPTNRIRLDLPVFVDPGIPIKEIHKMAGIEEWISPGAFFDGKLPPEAPYIYRLHSLHPGISVEDAPSRFEPDEVGITLLEASALCFYYPDFLEKYGFFVGETSFELNRIKYHPRISKLNGGGARLDIVDAEYKSLRYGILTRSKEIYLPVSIKP